MANQKSSSWGKWVFLAILAGAGFGGWRWYSQSAAEAPVEYKTTPIARGDLVQQVTANGQLSPVKNVTVGTQVSGIVKDILVDFNSRVTNGQVIARIDPSTYEQSLEQAEAELANSKAALGYAALNLKRAEGLNASKLIPETEFDKAVVDEHQAQAVVRMREAAVRRAQVDLERTTIFAPIDGVVISRNVDVGQTVAASFNTPTLFQIANDLAKMQIDAMVSEADIGGIEEGQNVSFKVEAFPLRKFRGSVRQVRFAPTTNQNVVTYTSVVEVNNADLKLRPGMTATADILVSERKGVLRIPNAALRFRPPPNAIIVGVTNAPADEKPKAELATSGPFAGLPIPPWQSGGERRRPSEDERAAYEGTLTAEQKAKYQQIMAEMRARFAQGGGPGGGGGGMGGGGFSGGGGGERPRRSEPEGPRNQTVYITENTSTADGKSQVVLKPVTVKLGASDGSNTEIIEGLNEGDAVVTGTVGTALTATGPAPSPFGMGFGGGPRR